MHDSGEPVEDIVARLRPQLELLARRGPSRGLANLYHALAGLYISRGQLPAALEAATQSVAVGGAVQDDDLIAAAEHRRAWALMLMGRDEEALSALQSAAALAAAKGNHAVLGGVANLSALIAEDRGDFERARDHAVSALLAGERLGDLILVYHALTRLAAQAFFKGEWGEAHRHMERAQNLPERSPRTEAATALELGRLCMGEGAWEQATAHLDACIATASRMGIRVVERTAQCLLAERDLLEGRPQAALARLRPLLDRAGLEERMVTNYVLPVLAWAYLDLDGIEQAGQTIAEAIRRQRAGRYRFGLAAALRVQAQVALHQGDRPAAEQALEEGLALVRAMPYPHSEGRLLEVYSRLHLASGEVGAARERLEAALAVFRRLGALKDSERIAQLLSTIGNGTAR